MPVELPDPLTLAAAVADLRAGRLVGLPTETVYGLAARASDPEAIARVFAAKARPTFNPLIVHLGAEGEPDPLTAADRAGWVKLDALPPARRAIARRWARRYWPGPLTLVLPAGPTVPALATAGLDTVAVRVPDHPVALALLAELGEPVVAPSANRSGRVSPTDAEAVRAELGERVTRVLDGGPCRVGVESTVVHLPATGRLAVLRPGAIAAADLAATAGEPVDARSADTAVAHRSPGTRLAHYAPATPMRRLDHRPPRPWHRREGLLSFSDRERRAVTLEPPVSPVWVLSPSGSVSEAAQALFRILRSFDDAGVDVVWVVDGPPASLRDDGLGFAIRERLERAMRAHHHYSLNTKKVP